jgi:hypothetical protein
MDQQNKMADNIKMAAKHEFSIALSIFMVINWNLGLGKNVIENNIVEVTYFSKLQMAN